MGPGRSARCSLAPEYKIAPKHVTHARRSRPPSARSLRDETLKAEISDETLKAEISKVHKNQLLGSGGPQDARDAGPA